MRFHSCQFSERRGYKISQPYRKEKRADFTGSVIKISEKIWKRIGFLTRYTIVLHVFNSICWIFAFFRTDKFEKIQHFPIFDSHVSLFIERSKTDVYKEGSTVVISRTPNDTCPVATCMLEKYLRKANIMPSSEEFIFRSILYCKKSKSYKLRNGNKPLSYTRAREILLEALKSLGLESGNFGLHSLRSGGATAAASNGITDRLFKKHGRWKSEKAKDGYVQENLLEKVIGFEKIRYLIR